MRLSALVETSEGSLVPVNNVPVNVPVNIVPVNSGPLDFPAPGDPEVSAVVCAACIATDDPAT